jgi:hypothetical protein
MTPGYVHQGSVRCTVWVERIPSIMHVCASRVFAVILTTHCRNCKRAVCVCVFASVFEAEVEIYAHKAHNPSAKGS